MPKLSDTKIRNTKPREKPFKLFDGDGLFLIVRPDGQRWWRQRYHWAGKEKMLSLGTYEFTSLAEARAKGLEVRKQVAKQVDPSAARREAKVEQLAASERTFKVVFGDWLKRTAAAKEWTEDHRERLAIRFATHFHPWIGPKAVADITDDDVLTCVRRIADRQLFDTARRALSDIDRFFSYCKLNKLVKYNPCADLRGPDVLPAVKTRHHAGITDPAQLGTLLRAIDAYHGNFAVRCALQLQALCFVRPGEMQLAQWPEFDLNGAEWRIPAERMKMRQHHIVPLSRQALKILTELKPVTGADDRGYVFPQVRNASRPISENTLNVAVRSCGFANGVQTAHGFRTTASTLLNESGEWHQDAIERQLAHGPRDKVRAAYNSAQYLPERREMMQWWANYLDGLRSAAKVTSTKNYKEARRVNA